MRTNHARIDAPKSRGSQGRDLRGSSCGDDVRRLGGGTGHALSALTKTSDQAELADSVEAVLKERTQPRGIQVPKPIAAIAKPFFAPDDAALCARESLGL